MSWLSTLFSGDPTANKAAASLTSTGSTATGEGLSDVNSASKFFQSIMNGNYSVLAPQTSAIQKQGQQKLQTASQFGNRSGGTNASMQQTGDTTRSSINDLIAQLTGSGATSLASVGSNLVNAGTNATTSGADISIQNKSIANQLLQSVGSGVGSAVTKWALS